MLLLKFQVSIIRQCEKNKTLHESFKKIDSPKKSTNNFGGFITCTELIEIENKNKVTDNLINNKSLTAFKSALELKIQEDSEKKNGKFESDKFSKKILNVEEDHELSNLKKLIYDAPSNEGMNKHLKFIDKKSDFLFEEKSDKEKESVKKDKKINESQSVKKRQIKKKISGQEQNSLLKYMVKRDNVKNSDKKNVSNSYNEIASNDSDVLVIDDSELLNDDKKIINANNTDVNGKVNKNCKNKRLYSSPMSAETGEIHRPSKRSKNDDSVEKNNKNLDCTDEKKKLRFDTAKVLKAYLMKFYPSKRIPDKESFTKICRGIHVLIMDKKIFGMFYLILINIYSA